MKKEVEKEKLPLKVKIKRTVAVKKEEPHELKASKEGNKGKHKKKAEEIGSVKRVLKIKPLSVKKK